MLPVWYSPAYEKGGFDLNNHSYLAWTFKQKKQKKKKKKKQTKQYYCRANQEWQWRNVLFTIVK